MKNIKTYELFNFKIKKGDLVLTEYTFNMRGIYLVLKTDKFDDIDIVKAFFIGTIDNKKVNLLFNTKNLNVYQLSQYTFLSKDDKIMLFDAVEKDTHYLDIIKTNTGIDLRESIFKSEDYKRYLIEKDTKKYNL